MNESILINNGVNLEGAMEYAGDMEMYNDIIQEFIPEAEEQLKNLEKYKNENDLANYAIYAHSLKASARYLGFTELFDISYKHELAAKANNMEEITSSYQELIEKTNKMMAVVKEYLGE